MIEVEEGGATKYSASSPDELALVMGAKFCGITYLERTTSSLTIQLYEGSIERYEILAEFPFDSTRKRMTLLVRFNNKYLVLTKGADSIMMPRLTIDKSMQEKMEADLYKFACDGLRTLVMSQKEITEAEYKQFEESHRNLKTSLDSNKELKLNELYDSIEMRLSYVGASAIEDKL